MFCPVPERAVDLWSWCVIITQLTFFLSIVRVVWMCVNGVLVWTWVTDYSVSMRVWTVWDLQQTTFAYTRQVLKTWMYIASRMFKWCFDRQRASTYVFSFFFCKTTCDQTKNKVAQFESAMENPAVLLFSYSKILFCGISLRAPFPCQNKLQRFAVKSCWNEPLVVFWALDQTYSSGYWLTMALHAKTSWGSTSTLSTDLSPSINCVLPASSSVNWRIVVPVIEWSFRVGCGLNQRITDKTFKRWV